jgi:hypothetical protein
MQNGFRLATQFPSDNGHFLDHCLDYDLPPYLPRDLRRIVANVSCAAQTVAVIQKVSPTFSAAPPVKTGRQRS